MCEILFARVARTLKPMMIWILSQSPNKGLGVVNDQNLLAVTIGTDVVFTADGSIFDDVQKVHGVPLPQPKKI